MIQPGTTMPATSVTAARTRQRAPCQQGLAIVELALAIPFIITILVALLLFGRALYNHALVLNAAREAARYMSSVPAADIRSLNKVNAHIAFAQTMVAEELSSMMASGPTVPTVSILCNDLICDAGDVPPTITVGIRVPVVDLLFEPLTSQFTFGNYLMLTARSKMAYVGG